MQKFRLLLALAVVVGMGVFAALGARAQAPTGAGAERAARFPVKLHGHDIESTFIRMPLPAGEEKYGRLQGDRLKSFVNEITGVSRKSREDGELLWGRIAGTKYDDMVETLVEEKFKAWGLQSHRQYFDLPPQWFPTSWEFRATGAGKTVEFKTVRPARGGPATPASGVDLEAVWVGLGRESDFADRDVKGKLAVLYSFPTPGVVGHTASRDDAVQRAADRGAAAVLLNIAIPGNVQVATGGSSDVPTFTIGTEDMAAFQALMNQGTVKVHLQLGVERRAGLRDANVWGILPGTTDEDIIVMAHHDGYFESALDNASGMAVVLGLAEYFSKVPPSQRRRTLKFVTTSGHHAGSLGVRWMHDNKATFLAKTALAMNAEHVSAIQIHWDRFGPGLRRSNNISARRWFLNGSDKLAAIVLNAYKKFGVTIYEDMDPIASGDMGSIERDVPSLQLIESALYYHTDHDRPDYVPAAGLEAVARAYAKIIEDVNELQRAELVPGPYATPSRRTTSLP